MTYDFRLEKTPYDDLIQMIRWSKERNDAKSSERKQDWINFMKMLGKGVGAYKMNKDYEDWKADQDMWDSELSELNNITQDFDADEYDAAASDRLIEAMIKNNPYALPGNVGANQAAYTNKLMNDNLRSKSLFDEYINYKAPDARSFGY